jgi:hypothetical protein
MKKDPDEFHPSFKPELSVGTREKLQDMGLTERESSFDFYERCISL